MFLVLWNRVPTHLNTFFNSSRNAKKNVSYSSENFGFLQGKNYYFYFFYFETLNNKESDILAGTDKQRDDSQIENNHGRSSSVIILVLSTINY